jgi:aldose sugar dehydrogenase
MFPFAWPLVLLPFAACGDDGDAATSHGGTGGVSGRSGASGQGGVGGVSGQSGAGGQAGVGGTVGQGGAGGAPGPGGPTLTRTVWLGGLERPWDIAFLPDGQAALITERPGRVSLVPATGGQAVAVEGPGDVLASGEGGMLGMTLDPEFATNRSVYICFSHRGTPDGEPNDNRVVRFRLSDDSARLEQRADIIAGMPYSTGRHSGCRLLFGPDGFLYVGTGDAAIGTTPQDLQSLGGKTLRVTRDGAAAPGNPQAAGKDDRIFTFGHRNIQGLALQPGTERFYTGEHGPGVDDEMNLIVPGKNYGWNPSPPYNEGVPMTDLEEFPDAMVAVWSSGQPTTALAGITFLSHPSWGDWAGAIVGAELKNKRLRLLRLDEAGTSTTEITELFVAEGARLRTVVMGPEGALYVATDAKPGGDEIWRVVAQ